MVCVLILSQFLPPPREQGVFPITWLGLCGTSFETPMKQANKITEGDLPHAGELASSRCCYREQILLMTIDISVIQSIFKRNILLATPMPMLEKAWNGFYPSLTCYTNQITNRVAYNLIQSANVLHHKTLGTISFSKTDVSNIILTISCFSPGDL